MIDHKTQKFDEILRDYDVVLNSLCTDKLEKSLRVLKPGGKLTSISGPPDLPSRSRTVQAGCSSRSCAY